jgi:putative ATP-dependent endonuclease of the OLD family
MKINSITIEGFKSFNQKVTINLNNLTAFIGSNGVGKTAVLEALARLFSIDKSLRNINNDDFYLPLNEKLEDKSERDLFIEVRIFFPELSTGGNTSAVATSFQQMIIDENGGEPYCRIRLESKWINSSIPGGDIEQNIYWITTSSDIVDDTNKQPLNNYDRSIIQLHYIPATRNPLEHLKQSSNSIMNKLLMSINWSKDLKDEIESFSSTIKSKFQSQVSIKAIQRELSTFWNNLFTSEIYKSVNISPFDTDFKKFLSKSEITFTPSATGEEESLERLSDGMKSLFYFSLIGTLFEIENRLIRKEKLDIDEEKLEPAIFNIFAIEEPENHLSPHYLGRIMKVFRNISNSDRAQVLITSHTPTIIKRVEPEEIRHIRLNNRQSVISSIMLPDKTDEAFKYVKEAVKSYPELYFSKLVLFGEGDSEELVLSKIAESFDILIDQSFISIVPLGGRFVNHFWKLLNQLGIPYITLLDYDRGRGNDGGFGRIKYVLNQLINLGIDKNTLLKLSDGSVLSDENLSKMHTRSSDGSEKVWINYLEAFNVYFSYPLDIDFMMLEKFPTQYKKLNDNQRGPFIPETSDPKYKETIQIAIASVLKKTKKEDIEVIDIEVEENYDNYFWYRYLFLGQGKPTSHINALSELSLEELSKNCPDVLKKIMDRIKSMVEV